ncbi:hypothetical protein Peur_040258 [Populus x canadensis]
MGMGRDIYVVTGPGQGHLRPCMHLCNLLNKRNYHTTLVLSSTLSSAIPPSFAQNPLTTITQIAPSSRPLPGSDLLSQQAAEDLRAHLSNSVPVIGLFTFGASAAAMEWGAWKVQANDVKPGETRLVPGLPEEMAITYWDLKRKELGPPGGLGQIPGGGGPPGPGDKPPWVSEIEGLISDPVIREQEGGSNLSEQEVIQWLDTKPRGSVLYVAFGSEVRPSADEYKHLADALEDWSRPFIWVVQHDKDHRPDPGLQKRVGNRVNYLKVGYRVADDLSEMVKRGDIVKGLERLMGDEEMRDRMVGMKSIFDDATPDAAFDSFGDFVNQKL